MSKHSAPQPAKPASASKQSNVQPPKREEESTQPSDVGEFDRSSRFPYGYVLSIPSEAKKKPVVTVEYVLTRRLGQGGFSEVRSARLRSNPGARFAVKVIDLQKTKALRIGKAVHWEIEILKKLQNAKHVIQMFESKVIEKNVIFIVLEMGGQSLDHFPKPSNGEKHGDYVRQRFKQCVMAVQQASKGLDVWALGCVLFWMATGQKLWNEPRADLRRAITTKSPDYSAVNNPDVLYLLIKIFQKERRNRPSCEEILKFRFVQSSEDARTSK
ncbi:Non-specific serine/threonine protein kinase [Aphelenchoides fujianensis]|nr:Non-specific serine/threonine protein kinase [Aphelenchoides fujianensis]